MREERVRSRVRREAFTSASRRLHGDHGSIIAEAALLTPFFITLLFGMLEFGGAFRDYLTTSNAASSGARQAAIQGNANDADWFILQAIKTASAAMPSSQIVDIEIFKATATTTGPPATCNGQAANTCNDYTGANLQTYLTTSVEPVAFQSVCVTNSAPEGGWCPETRNVSLQGGPDYVGIYLKVTHPWITGLFGNNLTMKRTAVIQLEPQQLTVNG
jgi:Flp pilus assembly protein TadG